LDRDLSYDDFKSLALDNSLSSNQKVGFPDEFRTDDQYRLIFHDLCSKVANLSKQGIELLDIGCGCSLLSNLISSQLKHSGGHLWLCDSLEMLSQCEKDRHITHVPGEFPGVLSSNNKLSSIQFDVIIAYSVIQYVFLHKNLFSFIDSCLEKLKPGGQLFLGDIPNTSMRNRFLASDSSTDYHNHNYPGLAKPSPQIFSSFKYIDDSIIISILHRSRNQGYHSFVLPQPTELSMANRREDILIIKP